MSDSLPPVAKSSCDSESRPSEGSEPGTVDSSLNEAPRYSVIYGDDNHLRCVSCYRRVTFTVDGLCGHCNGNVTA